MASPPTLLSTAQIEPSLPQGPPPSPAPNSHSPPSSAPTAALPIPTGLDNAEESSVAITNGGTVRTFGSGAPLTKNVPGYTIRKVNRPPPGPNQYSTAPPPSAMTPATPAPPASTPATAAPSQAFPALHLTPLNDTFVPKQISLAPPGIKVRIGRQTNAKTVPNGSNGYFDSKVLSRMHAEVWSEDGKIFIKDVKSSNGTFINGQRLSAEAAESDIFELHTEDVVEFGIDIVSDDSKTIIHHKVAAKVYLVMNQDDAVASSREFSNWYRHAGEQPAQRRPVKPTNSGSNGLSFEHVLNRLQGELQKSRDTSTNLGDLTSTLNEVHDTLGGGPPPPLPSFPHPSRGPPAPYTTTSNGSGPQKDLHAQSIAALQSQLNETQSSLAGHVGKIRDLEGLLAEHDVIKREVGTLRKQMEEAQRDMESMMRGRASVEEDVRRNGRESPIAALLEAQEAADDEDDEDPNADARSISSVETIRLNTTEQLATLARGAPNGVHHHLPNGTAAAPNGVVAYEERFAPAAEAAVAAAELAHERQLQEQNSKLAARLDALSSELDEATKLGQSLRSQHAEASSTIRALEARIQGLEKAVEGRVAEVEGKVLAEAESRWKGWRDAFEESWKRERESWDVEREKLQSAVREWEESKRGDSSDGSDWEEKGDADEVAGGASVNGSVEGESGAVGSKGPKAKRPRSRRRRRSTATRVSTLAVDPAAAALASDSDSTIGDSSKAGGPSAGPWNGSRPSGPFGGNGFGGDVGPRGVSGNTHSMPLVQAGAVVIFAVAAGYAIALKLKE